MQSKNFGTTAAEQAARPSRLDSTVQCERIAEMRFVVSGGENGLLTPCGPEWTQESSCEAAQSAVHQYKRGEEMRELGTPPAHHEAH